MKAVRFLYLLLFNTVIIPVLLQSFSSSQTSILCFAFFWSTQTWCSIFLSREEFSEHLCYRPYTLSLDVQGQAVRIFGSKAAHENYRSCNYGLHNKSLQKIQPGSLGYFFFHTHQWRKKTFDSNRPYLFAVCFSFFLCHRTTYTPHVSSVHSNSPPSKAQAGSGEQFTDRMQGQQQKLWSQSSAFRE